MQLRPGYKQSEVGVIPKDWNMEVLEGVCVPGGLVRGPFGGAIRKEFFVKDGLKVYEQRNAIYRDADLGSYYIDEGKYKELKRFEVKEGDFIVSCSGTIGRIFQVPKNARAGIINQALLKIKTNSSKIHDKFFFYVFDWEDFQQKIIDNTQGGAMQNLVGMDIFRSIPIPLPPLPEQRAIAAALSDVDAMITSLDKHITKKRDIKQATKQQLLTGKRRLPGFTGEWKMKRLGEIAEIGMGRTPSRSNQSYWGRGHKWLSIADLKSKYVFETKEEITALAASDMSVIPKGTLVMSFKLSIGRVAFTGRDMYSNEAICSFSKLRADGEYLYYILGQTDFSLYGKQAVKGYTLNTASINAVEIPYPPLSEQQAIAAVLSDMDAEIAALERKRDKTRDLKQGMMQELLTGKTRLV